MHTYIYIERDVYDIYIGIYYVGPDFRDLSTRRVNWAHILIPYKCFKGWG